MGGGRLHATNSGKSLRASVVALSVGLAGPLSSTGEKAVTGRESRSASKFAVPVPGELISISFSLWSSVFTTSLSFISFLRFSFSLSSTSESKFSDRPVGRVRHLSLKLLAYHPV